MVGFDSSVTVARLAAHRVGDRLGVSRRPHPVGLQLGVLFVPLPRRVEPLARVLAGLDLEAGVDLPVVAADEGADLLLALDDDGQGRGLDAADRGQEEAAVARVEGGHRAGAVDADQPVRLGPRPRGIGQPVHLLVAAQRREAVANGLRRHRLQPQPANRLAERLLAAAGVLLDQPEDQLALAPGVARVDQLGHVGPLRLADHGGQPRLGPVDRLQVEVGRDHRQVREAPLPALDVELLRRLDFEQVTDRARDHVAVVFEMFVVFLELAGHRRQRPDDVLRHRRFFRDYQSLRHIY